MRPGQLFRLPARGTVKWGAVEAVSVVVAIYIISQVIAAILLTTYLSVTGKPISDAFELLNSSTSVQFIFTLFSAAAVGWLVYYFLRRRETSPAAIGLVRPRWRDLGYVAVSYVVYLLLYLVLLKLVEVGFPAFNVEQEQNIGFSTQTAGLMLIPVFISLVVLPPLMEETLARGVLFSGLRTQMTLVMATIITSILFASAHLPASTDGGLLWVAAVDTFVLSIVLVYLRNKTGSLWPCIGLHALKNGVAFLALFVFRVG